MARGDGITRIIGLLMMGGAVAISYFLFFRIAPYITSTIPSGAWHDFISIIVYIVVGYLGGIAIPLALLVSGFLFLIKGW